MSHRSAHDHGPWVLRHRYVVLALTVTLAGLAAVLLLGGGDTAVAQASSDAATKWVKQDAGSAATGAGLTSVAFVDAVHGWVVGAVPSGDNTWAPVILATTDGGATWTSQDASSAGGSASLQSVTFADAAHGWAVGRGGDGRAVILATMDGGATWNAQDASSAGTRAQLEAVAFGDATHGWAVGENMDSTPVTPVILATSDGGASWQVQEAVDAGADTWLRSVTSVDATHAWAVGVDQSGSRNASFILVTTDGGATWVATEPDNGVALESVAFADASHGWAVGESDGSAVILATSDGGPAWTRDNSRSNAVLKSVAAADASHGWAVGYDSYPVILATSDGGATWNEQDAGSAGSDTQLLSVAFVDAAHGWAVGNNGAILVYHDSSSAGAANSMRIAVVVVALVIIGGLGVALAIHRRKVTRVAAAGGLQAPDPRGSIDDNRPPGAVQVSGEKARYCSACGVPVGAGSKFCASCGAKTLR